MNRPDFFRRRLAWVLSLGVACLAAGGCAKTVRLDRYQADMLAERLKYEKQISEAASDREQVVFKLNAEIAQKDRQLARLKSRMLSEAKSPREAEARTGEPFLALFADALSRGQAQRLAPGLWRFSDAAWFEANSDAFTPSAKIWIQHLTAQKQARVHLGYCQSEDSPRNALDAERASRLIEAIAASEGPKSLSLWEECMLKQGFGQQNPPLDGENDREVELEIQAALDP